MVGGKKGWGSSEKPHYSPEISGGSYQEKKCELSGPTRRKDLGMESEGASESSGSLQNLRAGSLPKVEKRGGYCRERRMKGSLEAFDIGGFFETKTFTTGMSDGKKG